MKVLFTKNPSLIGSRAIMWGLDEPCSHVAMVFFQSIVFHSTLAGIHLEPLVTFLEKNEIVYEIDIEVKHGKERELFDKVSKERFGGSYDMSAFLYFGWRVFLKKFFNKPLPLSNKFNSRRDEFCVEFAATVLGMDEIDTSMMSPYQLYLFLEKYGSNTFDEV